MSSSSNTMRIRIATKSDQDVILNGFRNWYWPYEPLSIGFDIKQPSTIEEETFLAIPEKGLSLLATTQILNNITINDDNTESNNDSTTTTDNSIEKPIGFLINGLDYPTLTSELNEKFENCNCERMLALINIMNNIEKQLNIFDKYNVDKTFHFISVAVDPDYRGKSIGKKLFERGFQMAKTLGFKIVSVDCTSLYSINIAEKLRMECIAEIEYINYKDCNGKQIFKPPAPHTHMKRFIKVL